MDDRIQRLTLLSGLEEAKRLIEQKIAEIQAQVGIIQTQPQPQPKPKKRRNISDELRERRQSYMAKARAAKLATHWAQKAGLIVSQATDKEEGERPAPNSAT